MEFPTLIYWISQFPFLGLLGGIFLFYSNFNRTLCKQTVGTLVRRRILRRLVWVYTVCLCPKERTLGLNGLNKCLLERFIALSLSLSQSKKGGKDQESIQSSTTSGPGYNMGK